MIESCVTMVPITRSDTLYFRSYKCTSKTNYGAARRPIPVVAFVAAVGSARAVASASAIARAHALASVRAAADLGRPEPARRRGASAGTQSDRLCMDAPFTVGVGRGASDALNT